MLWRGAVTEVSMPAKPYSRLYRSPLGGLPRITQTKDSPNSTSTDRLQRWKRLADLLALVTSVALTLVFGEIAGSAEVVVVAAGGLLWFGMANLGGRREGGRAEVAQTARTVAFLTA